jgi:hypothetical protein
MPAAPIRSQPQTRGHEVHVLHCTCTRRELLPQRHELVWVRLSGHADGNHVRGRAPAVRAVML